MTNRNRFAKLTQAFALFALIAVFAAAAFPTASQAATVPPTAALATGKVTVLVLDQYSGKPIQGAQVTFRTSETARPMIRVFTDANGQVGVELREGLYTAEVIAKAYKPFSELVKVAANWTTEAKVALYPDNFTVTPPTPTPVPFTN